MTNSETSIRTLRDELVEEMRKYEPRDDSLITAYFNDQRDDEWHEVSVTLLDDYLPQGGDIDAVVYTAEYVYILERAPGSQPGVPAWTFRGVPRQKRLFGLKRTAGSSEQTQLTDLTETDD